MTRIFKVATPERQWSSPRYSIEGKHRWGLPGVTCEACTTWANRGSEYPGVELPAVVDKSRYVPTLKPIPNTPVASAVLDELRSAIRHVFPSRAELPPGTKFGKFVGAARGTLTDFCWWASWTLFVKRGGYERLIKAGVKGLLAVETEIIHRGRISSELLEFQVEPWARLARVSLPEDGAPKCKICGRRAISAPPRTVLEASSIPRGIDLFRGAEMTTWFFATERFYDTVRGLGLEGVEFEEVEVEENARPPKRRRAAKK